jgi:uncharacterized protein YcbK (DUF882 family)
MTKNFHINEFASKCGRPTPESVKINLIKLAVNLQVLRDHLGKSIKINSGYRSPEHNKAIGGAKNSQHVKGNAADIVVVGMTPKQVYQTIEKLISEGKMLQGGLKAYNSFCHYDCRGVKARW